MYRNQIFSDLLTRKYTPYTTPSITNLWHNSSAAPSKQTKPNEDILSSSMRYYHNNIIWANVGPSHAYKSHEYTITSRFRVIPVRRRTSPVIRQLGQISAH